MIYVSCVFRSHRRSQNRSAAISLNNCTYVRLTLLLSDIILPVQSTPCKITNLMSTNNVSPRLQKKEKVATFSLNPATAKGEQRAQGGETAHNDELYRYVPYVALCTTAIQQYYFYCCCCVPPSVGMRDS